MHFNWFTPGWQQQTPLQSGRSVAAGGAIYCSAAEKIADLQ